MTCDLARYEHLFSVLEEAGFKVLSLVKKGRKTVVLVNQDKKDIYSPEKNAKNGRNGPVSDIAINRTGAVTQTFLDPAEEGRNRIRLREQREDGVYVG
jgi:hypothetical protein